MCLKNMYFLNVFYLNFVIIKTKYDNNIIYNQDLLWVPYRSSGFRTTAVLIEDEGKVNTRYNVGRKILVLIKNIGS